MSDAKRPKTLERDIAGLLLDEDKVKKLASTEFVDDALACAMARGIVMYPTPSNKREAAVVPMTLLPCPFADNYFQLAKKLTPDFHLLMDKITCDIGWLERALAKTGAIDEICSKLLEICRSVYNAETGKDPKEEIRLHLMRNDFMLDTQKGSEGAMIQIELNMMSASFAGHGQDLTEVHRYLLSKYLPDQSGDVPGLPRSAAMEGMAEAIAMAHEAYSSRWEPLGLPRVVLFIVLEEEKNELDHRKLELAAFQQGICSLRRSLAQLSRTCELRPLVARKQTNVRQPMALVVDGYEVTVAYFRSGYWPQHFEGAWLCRQQLERSEAAKCPSAPAQLAGMKKVQQLLCDSAELSRFLSEEQAAAVSSTFAKQFDPSNTSVETREAVQAARKSPGDWVLKPQVEGSGELYFDDDIPRVLESRSEDQLAEFILMERVRPPCTPSAILHDGAVLVRRAVAELGIFGTFVADGDKVRCNKVVGHLLRSKGQQTNQGGVFVGNATVDVPFLVPSDIYWRNVTA
ncbi:Glutathione synthetase (GSH synthetase) (GSH-S) (Glutathione synthase) [Durusdinium trenchii]